MDCTLAASQLDIGESSNLAQIIQTYSKTYTDMDYDAYISILSVLAQCAIDNAKRRFDVDISAEIKRIKKEVNVKQKGYPRFWLAIHPEFNKRNINPDLTCSMNCIYDYKSPYLRSKMSTLPFEHFFVKHPINFSKRKSKKIESMISRYALKTYDHNKYYSDDIDEETFILRSDFEDLINAIRMSGISNNYIDLMSYLISKAFQISDEKYNKDAHIMNNIMKHKSVLLKVLYEVNKKSFLKCFTTIDKEEYK